MKIIQKENLTRNNLEDYLDIEDLLALMECPETVSFEGVIKSSNEITYNVIAKWVEDNRLIITLTIN